MEVTSITSTSLQVIPLDESKKPYPASDEFAAIAKLWSNLISPRSGRHVKSAPSQARPRLAFGSLRGSSEPSQWLGPWDRAMASRRDVGLVHMGTRLRSPS